MESEFGQQGSVSPNRDGQTNACPMPRFRTIRPTPLTSAAFTIGSQLALLRERVAREGHELVIEYGYRELARRV